LILSPVVFLPEHLLSPAPSSGIGLTIP